MPNLELKIPPVAVFGLFAALMWAAAVITDDYTFDARFRYAVMAAMLLPAPCSGWEASHRSGGREPPCTPWNRNAVPRW